MLIKDEEFLSKVKDIFEISKNVLLILQEDDDCLFYEDVLLQSIIVTENQVLLYSQEGKMFCFKLHNIMVNNKGEIEMDYFVTSEHDDNNDFEGIYYLCLKMESNVGELTISRMINTDEENFDVVKAEYDELVGFIKKRIISIFDLGLKSKSQSTNKTNEKMTETSADNKKNEKSESISNINRMIWQCQCGANNKKNFCGSCGANKNDIWKCSCGKINSKSFCPKCGNKKIS